MKARRIAIFGYNHLSFELTKRLNRDAHEIIFADSDKDGLASAAAEGFNIMQIDYRSDDDLKKIGIGKDIDLIFCFFTEDCENVFLTLSARALAEDLEIISIVENPDAAEKLLSAGANKIINPYTICGRKIYERYKKPDISRIIEQTVFGRHDLHIAEVEIPKGSVLENMVASDYKLDEKYNLILIGVVDKELGEDLHFAIGIQQHKLDAGDILVVMGPSREIRAFKQDIEENHSDVI